MKQDYQLKYESENGGQVWVHPKHSIEELEENMVFATLLADKGKVVKLLPYVEGQYLRNPDAEVDGRLSDFKRPSKTQHLHNAIQAHIRTASKQGVAIVVLDLRKFTKHNPQIIRGVINGTQEGRNKNVKEVWLIMEGKKLLEINRVTAKEQATLRKLLD